MTRPISVLLVDDIGEVRRGLRMRLAREPDLQVIGEAEDGQQAIELAQALRPDVILLDVALPGPDGVATATQLQALAPRSRIVMLSLFDDAATRARARRAGAAMMVGKHESISTLLDAIRAGRRPSRTRPTMTTQRGP
jgi:DNA-binding NarL/FixJ family response regulator